MAAITTQPAAATTDSVVLITDQSIISQHNRGPITTLFVPPASCVETFTLVYPSGEGIMQYGYGTNYIDLACYPPASSIARELGTSVDLTSYFLGTSADWASYYYSPAICPYGYYEAVTFSSTIPNPDAFYPGSTVIAIGSETTAALCCPSGYSYQNFNHWCSSTITANQVVSYIVPRADGPRGWVPGPVSKSEYPAASYVWGNGVPIWYQHSDVAVLTAIPSTPSPTVSSTPRPTLSSTPTPTASSKPSSSPKSGLSTGAKVGLGVAIPLAALAGIATVFFFFFRSRRRRRLQNAGSGFVDRSSQGNNSEMPQLASSPVHEIFTHPVGYHSMHELPATHAEEVE
ncbi:hypothetical protein BU16DRAFT_559842 [Lophium mytilinum]|uniref:Uncharacterized protein n=1 Tax=Lophium mytilinum TaxID=390894 RepID=A0A6A6QZF6_9PEZI|nr:hypothetical protein BU16DRAFT_559842 [Lophium mytilinum]